MASPPETTGRVGLSEAKRQLLARRLASAGSSAAAAPAGSATAPGAAAPRVPVRPADADAVLSFAQERVWFMEQYAPGTAAYCVPVAVRLSGSLDVEVLGRAVGVVLARQAALRMRFPAGADGAPRVVVDEPGPVGLSVQGVASEAAAWEAARAVAGVPFDLAAGPLVAWHLLGWQVSEGLAEPAEHLLVVVAHHIVTDGWSLDLLVGDLITAYHDLLVGRPSSLPELPVSYLDYAAWQRDRLTGPGLQTHLDYWREQLRDVSALELPTDRPRPAVQVFDGADHEFVLDPELTAEIRALGRRNSATLYMTLLSGFAAVLARYSRQDDVAIGSPVAARLSPDVEGLVGMFVNLLTIRVGLDRDPTFAELLARARALVIDAMAHQELPFEQLVGELDLVRDVSRSPLFQAVFTMQNFQLRDHSESGSDGLQVSWGPVEVSATRFDMELQVVELADQLRCTLTYNTALFAPETMARLAEHWEALLRSVVADPDQPVSRISLVTNEERAALLGRWNDTAVSDGYESGATLPALILDQIRRTPVAVAVTDEAGSLTYAELDRRSAAVAAVLTCRGVGPEVLVGIACQRSVELVVGLLGILRAGGAYVPLDPDYPEERLRFMAEDSGFGVLLTQQELLGTVPVPDGVTVLCLDDPTVWPEGGASDLGLPQGPTDANAAYVIYTSGSTGRPKGVLNAHAGVVNRIRWMQHAYRLGADDAVLQKTPASFDVSVWEFFWPLMTGARLVMAKPGGHKDPAYLGDLIIEQGITTTHFVPSMLRVFLDEPGAEACTSLRLVVTSGEELPVAVARRMRTTLPAAELHNLYGPTEAAIDVSWWPVLEAGLVDEVRVPIGRPIDNITLHVLDERSELLPVGVPGELCIGGVGVARGYLGRPGLTADRFVPDPYGAPGSRLYRTGDLVRRRHDGSLDFLGRLDDQVKLRGQRIELGEIAAVLSEQGEIADAAVLVREDSPGDQRLVAYVVPVDVSTVEDHDWTDLKAAAKDRLPEYMIPQAFVALSALPLTANGKLDRRALPVPTYGAGATAAYTEPSTGSQRLVAGIWAEVLNVERIGADDDFFDLGGHSLLATQVAARLRTALAGTGVEISVVDLFKHRTVREIGVLIDAGDTGPRGLLNELTPAVPAARRVLSYVCVPYGGGSAIVYQPLADELPPNHSLYAVAIPGHDIGLTEEPLEFDELVQRCVEEILATVEGPLVLYGHCGVGGAVTVELARRLEARGRELEAVYIGAIFPFARPKGIFSLFSKVQDMATNTSSINRLKSMGVDMDELEPEQADRIISNMRHDSRSAEQHFSTLLEAGVEHIAAPIISVVGNHDPATDYFGERFHEWHFLSDRCAVVVLEEAGHFFLKYRARELAEIVTSIHPAVRRGDALREFGMDARGTAATWSVQGVNDVTADVGPEAGRSDVPEGPGGSRSARVSASGHRPPASVRLFLTVVLAQLVSMIGSTLTSWAIPVWLFLRTGSVVDFGLLWVVSMVPGLLISPLAGALTDRWDRRRVMIFSGLAAGASQGFVALLFATDLIQVWHMYVFAVWLSVVLTFQRLAYTASVPQLVPKQFLGYANGVLQLGNGLARVTMPILAAGLMALIGLDGILLIDVASYLVALSILAVVRFPALLGWHRRETLVAEIREGFRYSWSHSGLRYLLIYSALINLFLGSLLVLAVPLVLSFGGLSDVGLVSAIDAGGLLIGGLILSLWGGPRQRRVLGFLWSAVVLAVFATITGLGASVPIVAVGVFGTALGLAIHQGIGATIIQVKVPQRFHGRVFAINQMLAWSTLPIGFGLIAPLATTMLEPLVQPGGSLAGSIGAVIGVGEGRGIGLLYVVFGLTMVLLSLVAMRLPRFARFDIDTPDALPDDLIGAQSKAIPQAKELVGAASAH